MNKYIGITYPTRLQKKLKEWKKIHCSKNEHLFDEVCSDKNHYLHCDACGLIVHIKKIVKQIRSV